MSFIPERDPSEIYGKMGGNAEPSPSGGYKPGPETPHEVQHSTPTEQYQRRRALAKREAPHPTRILIISIATEPTGGFQLATQLKFSDLSSPTQSQAILDVLEELNNRLSAALGYCPI